MPQKLALTLALAALASHAHAQPAARGAASGDVTALSAMDSLIFKRAVTGDEAAMRELITRAKAGDETDASRLSLLLKTDIVKRSPAALAELRRRDAAGDTAAMADLDNVLIDRALTGDETALRELTGRVQAGDHNDMSRLSHFLEPAAKKGSQAALAELERRAATGDTMAIDGLNRLLIARAMTGEDAAIRELIARAKAGDQFDTARLSGSDLLETAAGKGSVAALAEIRRRNDAMGLDRVLVKRAVAGDKAALGELRARAANADSTDRQHSKSSLGDALSQLADRGDISILDELRRAADNGDGDARASLVGLYETGTPAVKRNLSLAAQLIGCPVPDEDIMTGCQTIDDAALPQPVSDMMDKLKCDDQDPSPVAFHLNSSETPAYKFNCYVPDHGASQAVVIARIQGRWKKIADIFGYSNLCPGFFPLKTVHAGLHDICLDNQCVPEMSRDHKIECDATILVFDGKQYTYHLLKATLPPSSESSR
jgi:hypothetical protein